MSEIMQRSAFTGETARLPSSRLSSFPGKVLNPTLHIIRHIIWPSVNYKVYRLNEDVIMKVVGSHLLGGSFLNRKGYR